MQFGYAVLNLECAGHASSPTGVAYPKSDVPSKQKEDFQNMLIRIFMSSNNCANEVLDVLDLTLNQLVMNFGFGRRDGTLKFVFALCWR